nr:PREDICTED: uncharacterized protein LOC105678796 [Linepithema humile]
MMKHPHFRLKVDLSKFFHDARQCCWVFVDGIKIQQVMHLKQHISELFNIAEPFHLLLNDTEYLPPAEDVRLLENNEMVLVVPGSGITNGIVHKEELSNDSLNKETQICDIKTKKDVFNKLDVANNMLDNTQRTSINNTRDITFYSVIDEDHAMLDDTDQDTDSKVTDNNLTEDWNRTESVVSIAKRKRVRKRKSKNRSSFVSPSDTKEEDKLKKPKIIDSYIIPTAKHIRFDNIESKENNIAKHIVQETSTNESYVSRTSSTKDLSMLLSLGQSSTPITFVNKKIKHDIKMDTELNNGSKKNLNKIIEEDISLENKLCNEETNKNSQSFKYFTQNIEEVPIITRKPQVKDIIAFKTLKIAADYTPQISNFIVTEVLELCEKTATYTLKILYGREEVQVPFGKFTLSDDESTDQPDNNMFLLNYAQMKELRLIKKLS